MKKLGIYIDENGIVIEVFENTKNVSFLKHDLYTEINILNEEADEIKIVNSFVFYYQ